MISAYETLASLIGKTPYRIAVTFRMFDKEEYAKMVTWFDHYDMENTVEDLIHDSRKRIVLSPSRSFLDAMVPDYGSVTMEAYPEGRGLMVYFTVNTRQKTMDELIIEHEVKNQSHEKK